MTNLKNIYGYLEKINFEKRIKEEVKFIRDRRNSHDFEAIVSQFVITQFVFSIVRDFYEEIYKDIETQNAELKELLCKAKGIITAYRLTGNQNTYSNDDMKECVAQIDQVLGEE